MRNLVVALQMASYLGLAVLFWRSGSPRLAVAQACYFVATGFIFLGAK